MSFAVDQAVDQIENFALEIQLDSAIVSFRKNKNCM